MSQVSTEKDGMNTKKIVGILVVISILLITAWSILGKKQLSLLSGLPFLDSDLVSNIGELDNATTKTPYNTKSLNITIDTPIDALSINSKTITLYPEVEGNAKLNDDKKTITYALNKPLTVGETYELRVAGTVKKSDGTALGSDKVAIYRATEAPKVVNMFPNGILDTLTQNITVIFNIPMVPLTNLDKRDTLPCPLTITPKLDGKCVWTNTSILEYIPSTKLEGATRYELRVDSLPGLLHPLEQSYTGEIMTTPLRVNTESEFSPTQGINLSVNFPVSIENLTQSLVLSVQSGGTETRLPFKIVPVVYEDKSVSETNFTIFPESSSFTYTTNYSLQVLTTLKPKYGTEKLGSEMKFSIHTKGLIGYFGVNQNMLNSSGQVIDTRSYSIDDGRIPSNHIFFNIQFNEEVTPDASIIALRSKNDQGTVPFDVKYGKTNDYDAQGNVINVRDDKYVLQITPKTAFKKNQEYEFVFLKKANKALLADEIKTFSTAPEFSLDGFKLISNTIGCVYTNNKVQELYGDMEEKSQVKQKIVTLPSSRVPTMNFDYGQYEWSNNGSSYTKKYICPQVSGKNAYFVDLRLNPNMDYAVDFTQNLVDEYNQSLPKSQKFKVKTGPIDEKDKFLFSSADGSLTQVIPNSLPIVLGIQSINLDKAFIDVCEMNQEQYFGYLKSMDSDSRPKNCSAESRKEISIKNRFWTLTPTQVDIEKEVLGKSFSSPFVYVHGYITQSGEQYNREFTHVFIRSNLSLTLEEAKNARLVFASSYDGKNLPENLTFEAYKREYIPGLFDGSTGEYVYKKVENFPIKYNKEKRVYVINNGDVQFDYLVAKNDSYYGILSMGNDRLSNYDFKYISGMDASSKDYLYIYPDRPLYKPTDTVYFKGILRNFQFDGYRKSETKNGKLKVVSGETTIAEMDMSIDENSNFHGQFVLPETVGLGRYSFVFYGSGEYGPTEIYNNGEFFIEAYKKPVFKVTTEIEKASAMLGDTAEIQGHAEYYFGGSLSKSEYQYSVLSQNYYFNPKEYQDYRFSRSSDSLDCLYWGSCDFSDALETSGTGVLDADGNTLIKHEYKNGVGEKIYTYSLEVTDPDTKKTVNHSVSQILHSTDGYVGIQVPYWNSGKSGIKTKGVVLDYDAKGLAGKSVLLELVKREWKNVKKEGVDGVFYNDGAIEETLISSKVVKSNEVGEFSYDFLSATGGEYEVKATYTGSNNNSFISSEYAYVANDDIDYYWYAGNNTVADIVADNSVLAVGDRAGFTLKTPIKSGKMLVSIEKDDGILNYFIQDIVSTTTRIEFPILDTYIPNVYVKVFALGQNPGEKLPIYKRGLSVVKVLPDPKKLTITVTAEKKKYLPGEGVKIKVQVRDANGKGVAGANGSLSIVDESLLALAGNPEKNPFAYFYDMKRYLGVETYSSLLNLVQKLEVKDTSLGEKGGAGEGVKGGLSKKKRGTFKDTAYWNADFSTDKNGDYTITMPALPDNLTTWVIEALVNTKDTRLGVGTTHIQTTKSVLINDNLPRFLGTSDTLDIAPVIFNKTDTDATFDVSVEATNVTVKNPTQSIFIKAGEQVIVPVTIAVDDLEKIRQLSPKATKITIKAISQATKEEDSLEVTIPIIETTTPEMAVTSGRADPNQDEQIELDVNMRKNGGLLGVNYAATLLPGLLSGLDFLAEYPYGCIEQKLAAIMPQVYMKSLYESIGNPYDLSKIMVKKYISREEGYQDVSIKSSIEEVIAMLPSYQKSDGGFGYWPNSEHSDVSLTVSVLSRLRDVARTGFNVPTSSIEKASKYIKSTFYSNIRPYCVNQDCSYSPSERLQMILAVIDANITDYEAYKMYKILLADSHFVEKKKMQDVDFMFSEAHLLIKLAGVQGVTGVESSALKDQAKDIARTVIKEHVVLNPRGAFIGRNDVYNRLANTLSFIEIVSILGGDILTENQTLIDQMNRWVMSQKKHDGSWGSTAETMRVIRTITTTEELSGNLRNVDIHASVTLDGTVIDKNSIKEDNKLAVLNKTLSLTMLKDSSLLRFEKTGTGKLYYDIALQYFISASKLRARDEGFYIATDYYDYKEYKRIESLKNEEWNKYLRGEIDYNALKYPKEVTLYLKPIDSYKVGQLVLAHNRMILAEPRDQVAFEGFIPSGAELVNPNLKTESQDAGDNLLYSIWGHEEWQDDRYFATSTSLSAGVYTFDFVFRPTHAGAYELRPSRAFEFYHPETFGRTMGKSVRIEK